MRNQKTIFCLFRLLALAVVSCALATLLTGCSKEEFIVGYKKFMFGDWLPGSSSSASSAASSSEESSEPEHVYDAPNPECDAKINALMSELYSLEASAQADVSSVVQAAKDEYHAQSDHSTSKKISIVLSYSSDLYAIQSKYDSLVSSIVSEMRSILREYNQPETAADQAWSYYQSAQSSMISSLRSQL